MDNQQNPQTPMPEAPVAPVMSEAPVAPVMPETPVAPAMPEMTAPAAIPNMTEPMAGPSPIPNAVADQPTVSSQPQFSNAVPAMQLKTDRVLWKVIVFSLITFGIYAIVFYCGVGSSVNTICSKYDNKKSMNFFLALLLGGVTCGIVPLVWFNNISSRMGDELQRRGINYKFSNSDFWIWSFLLSFTIVGPFIYINKLCTASNLLAADYNQRG